MNILFICHEYPPARLVGGIGIFVKNISQRLVESGCKVTVIGLYRQPKSTDEDLCGVRVVRLAAYEKLGLGWWLQRKMLATKIKQLHRESRFDIVETSDFDAGFWLIPRLDIPFVVRLNGGETYFRSLLGEPLKWKYKYREYASIRKADAISSVSEFTGRETRSLFKLKDFSPRILPNPVDTSFFKPSDTDTIIRGRIVYSGTFIRKKGVLDLFMSLPKVFDQVEDAHLVCVGADASDPMTGSRSTQKLALSLIDSKYHCRVHFTGRLPHEHILPYIQQANVCVYPSYLEAFPNAWIEAMACSKAVVASNTGSGPEVIRDGETGLLCHPSDHEGLAERIIRVLDDDYLCQKLGTSARRHTVEHLDIAHLLRSNIGWYKEVIDRYNMRDVK